MKVKNYYCNYKYQLLHFFQNVEQTRNICIIAHIDKMNISSYTSHAPTYVIIVKNQQLTDINICLPHN